MPQTSGAQPPQRTMVRRHSLPVRVGHWVNVLCMTILLMSGLQIFNAHPALYWGSDSDFAAPFAAIGTHPLLSITAEHGTAGQPRGILTVLGHRFDATGTLGVSRSRNGATERAFPAWATIPGPQWLAMGRRWHFFFAWIFVLNGAAYFLYSLIGGHFRRDFVPSSHELAGVGGSIWRHLRLRFPKGEEARRYNVLQKLSYIAVVFIVVPLLILAGLAMSPRLDAGFPFLPMVFGGRQSARTVHFACAFVLLLFTAVHLVMVLVSGVWNNMRSMITGRYSIEEPAARDG